MIQTVQVLILAIASTLVVVVLLLVIDLVVHHKWRNHMARTAELTAAVQALTDAVNALAARVGALSANVTPDSDVDAQVAALNTVTATVNTLAT
jgi:ribonuclease PH